MSDKCGIILAGGDGTRMNSSLPKTMSLVLEKPMLLWIIEALRGAGVEKICVVTGYQKESIEEYIKTLPFEIETVFQEKRLGTGHAVMTAKEFLVKNSLGDVIVLNGDAPFMDKETIEDAFKAHKEQKNAVTVISAEVLDPTGYGRIIRAENGSLLAIVEQKDATEEQQAVKEINSGAFWFDTTKLLSVLGEIKSNNKAGEYYLPDAVKLLIEKGENGGAFVSASSDTVLGANDPKQLEYLNEVAKNKQK